MTDIERQSPEIQQLREHVDTLDLNAANGEHIDLTRDIVVICPDDGKFIAFRGRCPKCGGDSWVPAGALSPVQLAMLDRVIGREATSGDPAPVLETLPAKDQERSPAAAHSRKKGARIERKR